MASEKTLLVHIGIQKTGTSAIQRFCFENRETLSEFNLAYWDGLTGWHSADGLKTADDISHHVLSSMWGGWINRYPDGLTPNVAWAKLVQSLRAENKKIIVSSEQFATVLSGEKGLDALTFIRDTLGFAEVKFICYIRRQDDLAESHFKELHRTSEKNLDIDDYVKIIPEFTSFNYLHLLDNINRVFGRESMVVRVFDRAQFLFNDLISDFLDACGAKVTRAHGITESRVNLSLSSTAVSILADPKLWFLKGIAACDPITQKVMTLTDRRGAAILDNATRRSIMDRFSESNKAVQERYLPQHLILDTSFDPNNAPVVHCDDVDTVTVGELKEILVTLEKIVVHFRVATDQRHLLECNVPHCKDCEAAIKRAKSQFFSV
jgi:hypothetical protein